MNTNLCINEYVPLYSFHTLVYPLICIDGIDIQRSAARSVLPSLGSRSVFIM